MTIATSPRAAPGRPREFDPDDAVRDALEVFRARGYHGASMVDLLEGTKLSRGSLYKAFPDKRTLFFASFDLYVREAMDRLANKLSADNARDGIRTALLHYAHVSSGEKGCMIVTAISDMLPDDEEATRRVEAYYDRMRHLFADAVKRGQTEGSVDRAHDPVALARYLQTLVQGFRLMAKTGASESQLRDVVACALVALGGRPHA